MSNVEITIVFALKATNMSEFFVQKKAVVCVCCFVDILKKQFFFKKVFLKLFCKII